MTLKEALSSEALLTSDGGTGTELQKLGLAPEECGDLWNLTHPERVESVHLGYIKAGSRLVTTNTFSANRFVLAKHGLQAKQAEIARSGAAIAQRVMAGRGWVMGSVGPCAALLEPLGDLRIPDLEESLRTQIGALLEGGADAILIETMTALPEIEVSIRVARQMKSPCIIATCAFDPYKSGPRTMMGATPEQFAKIALNEGADVIGANCGRLVETADFVALADRLRAASNLPIMIQPNGGQPLLEDGKIVYRITPEEMAERLARIAPHARIVGGCCGSNPAHIRAFAGRIRSASAATP